MKNNTIKTNQFIAYVSVFAALIVVGEAAESMLPALQSGGSLKLSEVVATATTVFAINQFKNKNIVFKIALSSAVIAIFASYFMGLFKYATTPTIFLLDYAIPFMAPSIIALALPKTKATLSIWVFIAAFLAFLSHVISGVVVWKTPLWGSITYNFSYCLLTAIVQITIALFIFKRR